MQRLFPLLLIVFMAFWSCEDTPSDTTSTESSILGSWDYYYYSREYEENPDWNSYSEIDSVLYNFTYNGTLAANAPYGTLAIVDSRNNNDGNTSGTEYWEFTSENDSIRIYDDTGESMDNYSHIWFYQMSNDSLMISRLHTVGSPNTIKKHFTRN